MSACLPLHPAYSPMVTTFDVRSPFGSIAKQHKNLRIGEEVKFSTDSLSEVRGRYLTLASVQGLSVSMDLS